MTASASWKSIAKALLYAFFAAWFGMMLIVFIDGIGNMLLGPALMAFGVAGGLVIAGDLVGLGLPVFLLLERFGLRRWSHYVLPSMIPGPLFIFLFKPFGNDPLGYLLQQTAICMALGAVAAATFWWFAVRPRADPT